MISHSHFTTQRSLIQQGDRSPSMTYSTDSTTSEGWTRKTNFREDGEEPIQEATVRIKIARSHATRLLKTTSKTTWFAGKENDVADALSRETTKMTKN